MQQPLDLCNVKHKQTVFMVIYFLAFLHLYISLSSPLLSSLPFVIHFSPLLLFHYFSLSPSPLLFLSPSLSLSLSVPLTSPSLSSSD